MKLRHVTSVGKFKCFSVQLVLVTQIFLMPLFVKVESGSSKLLRTVSKSGPNGCKERSRPQKMLMRIKIESFFGRQNLVLTVTHSHKQPREEQKMIVTWTALIIITKILLKSSDMVIKGSGVVPPGEISECTEKKSMTRNAHLSRGAD